MNDILIVDTTKQALNTNRKKMEMAGFTIFQINHTTGNHYDLVGRCILN